MTAKAPTEWAGNPTALASLAKKLQTVKDLVVQVATGYSTGLYLWGEGGVGKSHAVLECLDERGYNHVLFNSRMTARALFNALGEAPDSIHVLEDMERLTADRDAQGVLRSALWAAKGDRVVTWSTASSGKERFTFRGGIILIANKPLTNLPELRALATRIKVLKFDASDEEIEALFYDLASRGYWVQDKKLIDPEDCLVVAQFLLKECRVASCPLDVRLLLKSWQDFLFWESGNCANPWQNLVATGVRETVNHLKYELDDSSPEDKKVQRRKVVREVMAEAPDDVAQQERLYKKRTGFSSRDFFRRKDEVARGDFEEEET